MEQRLANLERSSQELLHGQKELRRNLACIVKTWGDFSDVYLPHLKLSLKREQDRDKLRQAIIEKGLLGALFAVATFVGASIWEHVAHILAGMPK